MLQSPSTASTEVVAATPGPSSARPLGTVRGKTLLALGAALLGLFVLLYVPLRFITLQSFAELEQQQMRRDVTRGRNVLDAALAGLDRTTRDYASWDDTYAFIQDRDPAYLEANFPPDTFLANQIGLVMLIDASGRLVHGEARDLATGEPRPLPARLQALSTSTDVLTNHPTEDSTIRGLLQTDSGLLMIASRPILTSAYIGPIRGTLVMGRWLDDAEIERLAQLAQLSLEIIAPGDARQPDDVRAVFRTLVTPETMVQPLDADTVAGYTMLPDVVGQPVAVLRVVSPRTIAAQGASSLWWFTLALVVSCLAFGGVMLWVLERVVLTRLSRLSANVHRLGGPGQDAHRVALDGGDELTQLARTINETLDARQRAEAERRDAEAASMRAKDEFVAMVSHELRTPLTAIRGYIDLVLLLSKDLAADQREHLQTARTNALRMTALVEDLLEIGRIDAGRLELAYGPVNLVAVVADVIRSLAPEAQRKEIAVFPEVAAPLPPLEADEKRMRQIVTNLVSNALKYTEAGGRIDIRITSPAADRVAVAVSDTGVGLTPEQQVRLFTRFYRADHRLRDTVDGVGLGLAISKALVELHSGTITVTSSPGVGSTFTVTLPTNPASE